MESNVIIIAACVPGLRPFIISVSRSMRGTEARTAPHSGHFVPRYSLNALSVGDHRSRGFHSTAHGLGGVDACSPSLNSRSDPSLPPGSIIKKDTQFTVIWEHV